MIKTIVSFIKRNESGATLVEYGIALVLGIIVGGTLIGTLAESVSDNISEADTKLDER